MLIRNGISFRDIVRILTTTLRVGKDICSLYRAILEMTTNLILTKIKIASTKRLRRKEGKWRRNWKSENTRRWWLHHVWLSQLWQNHSFCLKPHLPLHCMLNKCFCVTTFAAAVLVLCNNTHRDTYHLYLFHDNNCRTLTKHLSKFR